MNKNCLNCGEELNKVIKRLKGKSGKYLIRKKTKFCSDKCDDAFYYKNHKKKYIKNAKKWELENPEKRKEITKKAVKKFIITKRERFNELMIKSYKGSKNKWQSRNNTRKVLKCKRKKIFIEYKCKDCGFFKNLEIHHEVYPTKMEEIRQSIRNKKIYFLCKKCHNLKPKHLNTQVSY